MRRVLRWTLYTLGGLGERPFGMMRRTALHRLHLLTLTEVADLYAYLRERAGAPAPR